MAKKSIPQKEIKTTAPSKPKAAVRKTLPINWKQIWPHVLIITLLTIGLYAQSINYDFVLDDAIVVEENNFVKEGFSGIKDILTKESMTGYFGQQQDLIVGARYRPLSLVTFAIEHEFFGLDKRIYHLGNILFYVACCLIIFLFFCKLYPIGNGLKLFWNVPFVLSMIYVAHPLHTEAVANIKGRDEILSMLFAMATLWCCMSYINTANKKLLPISGLLFLLSLLAKENAITFIAVVPLFVYVYQTTDWKKVFAATLPLLLIFAIYLFIRYEAVGYLLNIDKEVPSLMNNPFVEASTSEKFATIFYTLGIYIKLHFFPHPLTHDYYPYHIPLVGWTDPRAFIPLLLYVGLAIIGLIGLRKHSPYAVGILYFIITLSIVSNLFVPIGTFMNERFMFMPSVGFCLIAAYFLVDHLPRLIHNQKVAQFGGIGIASLFLIGLSWKTYDRIPAWKNKGNLNTAAYGVSKNSARANQFMGYFFYEEATASADVDEKRKLYQKAEKCVDVSLKIFPQYIDALRTKAGIRAGYYQLGGSLQQLLDDFFALEKVRHIEYVEQYLRYLHKRADRQTLLNFYHTIGYDYFLRERNDVNMAYYYLKLGEELDAEDYQINRDLAIIGQRANNSDLIVLHAQKALQKRPEDAELKQLYQEAFQKQLQRKK